MLQHIVTSLLHTHIHVAPRDKMRKKYSVLCPSIKKMRMDTMTILVVYTYENVRVLLLYYANGRYLMLNLFFFVQSLFRLSFTHIPSKTTHFLVIPFVRHTLFSFSTVRWCHSVSFSHFFIGSLVPHIVYVHVFWYWC